MTNAGGSVVGCHDYLPFGEEIPATWGGRPGCYGQTDTDLKFTGKERDVETGLDYFGARYMSSAQGRFTSPDQPFTFADPASPQSWNMYSYALNNPLSNIDPSGLSCITVTNSDGVPSQADDGDGQGCQGAGVAPGNPDDIGDTVTSQEVNVNDQQGSWLNYLWATFTNEIPQDYSNDVPLNPFAQQLFKALGKKIDAYPTVCGGGWYTYAGKELEGGPVSGFVGAINEHDSLAGRSNGALFEGGYGEGIVGGAGYIGSTTGGLPQGTGLAYVGAGAKTKVLSGSVGLVGFGSGHSVGGVGIYGEGFRHGRGGGLGAYVNISSIGGCRK